MTSLSQHSPKNKTTRQLDLFADEAPAERADDVAPAIAAPAHPLAGAVVKLAHDRCKCGSDTAIVGDGNP